MENQPNTLGSLFKDAGDYIETRIDLLKLKAIDKSSDVASSVVTGLTTLLFGCFALLILNIGLALWIGDLLGKDYLGFFVIAGFYILLALLLHIFRNTWIKGPVTTIIIKKLLK